MSEATQEEVAFRAVARSSDLEEGGRLVVAVGELEIGLFRAGGALFAYENRCAHRGGPVCQGKIYPAVRETLADDGTSSGYRWDRDDPHIVCPWHGYEYRILTGEHPGDRRTRLRSFEVEERNGEIHVRC